MATPSIAEIVLQWQSVVDMLDALELFCRSNTPNWVGLEDVLTQAIEGEYTPALTAWAAKARSRLADVLSQASVRAALTPVVQEIGRLYGFPETDPVAILRRYHKYLDDNSGSVNSRDFTLGTPSAAVGNVGTGGLYRLSTDAKGYPIEAIGPESWTVRCLLDGGQRYDYKAVSQGGLAYTEILIDVRDLSG
jgi:hypothetical protein